MVFLPTKNNPRSNHEKKKIPLNNSDRGASYKTLGYKILQKQEMSAKLLYP